MRLFGYYAVHTVWNSVRKLFKTWVAIFIAVCLLFGILIGAGAVLVVNLVDDGTAQQEIVEQEQIESPEEETPVDPALVLNIVELAIGGLILVVMVVEVLGADKAGGAIFQPADAALLFASPMKPQSVLLFRLLTQIGLSIFASLYIVFQLPNLIHNVGLNAGAILSLLLGWMLLLVYGKLIQIFCYVFGSSHPSWKARLRPAVYAVVALIAVGYFSFWRAGGGSAFDAAMRFFNAPVTRWIPIWGWLKGFCMFMIEGNWMAALIAFAVLIAGLVLLAYSIWHTKVDFYEDAMAKSEELAAMREKAKESKGLAVSGKKKRSEKLERDGLHRGFGANVYFWKAMMNRFRFAHLKIFTKTSETYLVLGIAAALFLRFVVGTRLFLPVPLVFAVFAFYRSLGNPIAQDTGMDSFFMIPENSWSKMFWALMGGSINCLLDLIPGLLAAAILLAANPFAVLAWMLFILSVDFYAASTGVFLDLSVPVSTGKGIKAIFQVMFLYLGILPDALILILGGVWGHLGVAAVPAAVLNIGIGLAFFAASPAFLERGRR